MVSVRDVFVERARIYLAEQASDAVAWVCVEKAWCTPITIAAQFGIDQDCYRLRILTRGWLTSGNTLETVKLWYTLSSEALTQPWLRRLEVGSCWSVAGRVVDVGHPQYQTIAVSELQPLSASAYKLFAPMLLPAA